MSRSVADPVFYIIKVEDKIEVSVIDYYRILKVKLEEEGDHKQAEIVSKYLNLLGQEKVI
jgi:hypothetical protein